MYRMECNVIDGIDVLIAGRTINTVAFECKIIFGIRWIYILNGNTALNAAQCITW